MKVVMYFKDQIINTVEFHPASGKDLYSFVSELRNKHKETLKNMGDGSAHFILEELPSSMNFFKPLSATDIHSKKEIFQAFHNDDRSQMQ